MHKADAEHYLKKLQADQKPNRFAYLRTQKLLLNDQVDRKNVTNIWVDPEVTHANLYKLLHDVQQIAFDPDSIKGRVS